MPPGPGGDRIAVMAGPERNAFVGAVAIGVVLFVAGVFAIRAGGAWASSSRVHERSLDTGSRVAGTPM
jgi:hypothetical protein